MTSSLHLKARLSDSALFLRVLTLSELRKGIKESVSDPDFSRKTLTMTSLAAQNQLGTLIDASQRQPVIVTRRGRPVAVVLSYEDYQAVTQTLPLHVAALISENYPLRGKEAGDSMRQHLAKMSNKAADEGLTEDDLTRMLNED
jgi:prevent-host-death family protein